MVDWYGSSFVMTWRACLLYEQELCTKSCFTALRRSGVYEVLYEMCICTIIAIHRERR